jgi:hypothetical protein
MTESDPTPSPEPPPVPVPPEPELELAPLPPPGPTAPRVILPNPNSLRGFSFTCKHCGSRLEGHDSISGQPGQCPTCGHQIYIPIRQPNGVLIDPETQEVLKSPPHPVHAYAAAGHRAPQIVTVDAVQKIQCPRCRTIMPLTSNSCRSCGLPFTMDALETSAMSTQNVWGILSLVFGLISLPSACFGVVALAAITCGIIALRGDSAKPVRVMAIIGLVLGALSLCAGTFFWVSLP